MPLADFYPELKGWTDVTPDSSAAPRNLPPIPDPETRSSPYLRAPLPLPMQYSGDTVKQFLRPGISSFRISPVSPAGLPANNSAAKSVVQQIVSSTPAPSGGVTSVGLTMPTPVFASPVSGSPITSAGTLAPVFASEPFNYVFAGPGGPSGNVTLDGTTSVSSFTATNTSPYTASVAVSQAGDFVLCALGILGGSPTLPAGFTTIFNAGSPAQYIGSIVSTGAGTITASGVAGGILPIVEILAAFKSSGVTPTVRQTGSGSFSVGTGNINPFGLSVLSNSTIIAIVFGDVVGSPATSPAWTITDSQSNVYTQIQNGYSSYAPSGRAIFAQMFATPATTAGSLTITVTNPTNLWGTPTVYFLEVTGLAAPSFIPTFRPLVSADIPNLDTSKITTGLLPLARGGTNANLSATGGTSQFLRQASSGAAITVVQPDFSDLAGAAKISKYNNIAVVGNGVPSEPFQTLNTALAANYNAGAAKTMFTPTGAAMYRISFFQAIQQAATTSSTTPSLTLGYTDAGGIARTLVLVTSDSSNLTTSAPQQGTVEIFTNGSTAVTITSTGYASSGATAMQYVLAVTAEAL